MLGLFLFIIGTILGSFYLVVGLRMPLKENFITSRSRCDYCKTTLKWYELIPIVSYLIQGGKCRHCKKKISIINLIIEIISGILFLAGYLYFGLTIKYLIYLVVLSVAIIIFVSDLKYFIILDSPLIIGSILIIILRYFEIGFKGTLYSIFCGVFLTLVMFLIKKLGNFLFKKESLGDGDIKLCFFIGLSLGYPYIGIRLSLISLIFSAFLAFPYAVAQIYLNKKNELPYGPFLISSLYIVFIFIEKFSRLLIFFGF